MHTRSQSAPILNQNNVPASSEAEPRESLSDYDVSPTYRKSEMTVLERRMDSLARLLTPRETACIAVILFENSIMIFSNEPITDVSHPKLKTPTEQEIGSTIKSRLDVLRVLIAKGEDRKKIVMHQFATHIRDTSPDSIYPPDITNRNEKRNYLIEQIKKLSGSKDQFSAQQWDTLLHGKVQVVFPARSSLAKGRWHAEQMAVFYYCKATAKTAYDQLDAGLAELTSACQKLASLMSGKNAAKILPRKTLQQIRFMILIFEKFGLFLSKHHAELSTPLAKMYPALSKILSMANRHLTRLDSQCASDTDEETRSSTLLNLMVAMEMPLSKETLDYLTEETEHLQDAIASQKKTKPFFDSCFDGFKQTLATWFHYTNISAPAIGISKLCCLSCEDALTMANVRFAGSSNVDWPGTYHFLTHTKNEVMSPEHITHKSRIARQAERSYSSYEDRCNENETEDEQKSDQSAEEVANCVPREVIKDICHQYDVQLKSSTGGAFWNTPVYTLIANEKESSRISPSSKKNSKR